MERPSIRRVKRNPETGEREEVTEAYGGNIPNFDFTVFYSLPFAEIAERLVAADSFISASDPYNFEYISPVWGKDESVESWSQRAKEEGERYQQFMIDRMTTDWTWNIDKFIHYFDAHAALYKAGRDGNATKAVFWYAYWEGGNRRFVLKLKEIADAVLGEFEI